MCGRFASGEFPKSLHSTIMSMLNGDLWDNFLKRHAKTNLNTSPGEQAGIFVQDKNGPAAQTLEWGFNPQKSNDGKTIINARSEEAHLKQTWRIPIQKQRCLVPVLGFYEWQNANGMKIPFYFSAFVGQYPIFLGGLWSPNHKKFVILTTAANALMAPIHPRMPVIVPPQKWLQWLDPDFYEPSQLAAMMQPIPPELLLCWEVTRKMGNPSYKNEDCIQPATK